MNKVSKNNAAKNKVTNILCSVACPGYAFTERYVLPEYQAEIEALNATAEENDCPWMVAGSDGVWWNDDLVFMLDRMGWDAMENHSWPQELKDFKAAIENLAATPAPDKEIEFVLDDLSIVAKADCTPLTGAHIVYL